MPAPEGARNTMGHDRRPRVRWRIRDAWLMIWSIVGYMKPVNWISATGFRPAAAMPMATPAMAASASGVSTTRSAPKRACSPAVARKTPPFTPTSSPRTMTAGSCASSCASARLTASTRLTSATWFSASRRKASRCIALLLERGRQCRVKEIEHRVRTGCRYRKVIVDRPAHLLGAFALQRFFLALVPGAAPREIVAQPRNRLELPLLAHRFGIAIARRIVGRRVIAQPVGQRLDERRPAARTRLRQRFIGCMADRDDVVAVDLPALDTGGDSFLCQRLRRTLHAAGHRDRPLVVVDDQYHRDLPHAGHVQAFVEIAAGCSTVAQQAHRGARLAPQPEGVGRPHRMADLGRDRHAVGQVVPRTRETAAALIAAPVEQAFGHRHAAQELRRMVTIRGHQDVFRSHRARDPDADRFLPERGGERSDLARALQRDGLGIERAR